MRIGIVINTSWNIFNFRMGLVNKLLADGHEVYAICPRDNYSEYLTQAGCKFEHLEMNNTGLNPLEDAKLMYRLYNAYRRIKPDVILHYTIKPNIYGAITARMMNIPTINNVSGLGTVFLWNKLLGSLAKLLYHIAFRFPNFIFFQNEYDRTFFVDKVKIQQKKTGVLPGSGIDLEKFKPQTYQKNKKFTFLLIARLIVEKGINEYIEAARILKSRGIDAQFQLLGKMDPKHKRGITLRTIERWINEKVIEYLGTTDKVAEIINKADCVVLPSYREGTPRTLLEASSLAKPMVASDVPGCNNVVIDGYNGFLCEVKNAEDLADKMMEMATLSEEEHRKMSENSRKRVESAFDEKIVIDQYVEKISSVSVCA